MVLVGVVAAVFGHRVQRLLDDTPDPHVQAAGDAVHEAEPGRRLVVVDHNLSAGWEEPMPMGIKRHAGMVKRT